MGAKTGIWAYIWAYYNRLFSICQLLLRHWWESQETLLEIIKRGSVNWWTVISHIVHVRQECVADNFNFKYTVPSQVHRSDIKYTVLISSTLLWSKTPFFVWGWIWDRFQIVCSNRKDFIRTGVLWAKIGWNFNFLAFAILGYSMMFGKGQVLMKNLFNEAQHEFMTVFWGEIMVFWKKPIFLIRRANFFGLQEKKAKF